MTEDYNMENPWVQSMPTNPLKHVTDVRVGSTVSIIDSHRNRYLMKKVRSGDIVNCLTVETIWGSFLTFIEVPGDWYASRFELIEY